MIELHCHILPNVDDGAQDLDESLTMLRRMKNDGVTHVVATPHCTRTLRYFKKDIVPRVKHLNAQALKAGIEGIQVFPGSEISFYDAEEYRANYEGDIFCHLGGGHEYSLLEFPWGRADAPDDPLSHIRWMLDQGTTPILAHPERTPFLRENSQLVKQMHDAGAWIQITVDSVTGKYDAPLATLSSALINKFESIVIATDSHNLRRSASLAEGYNAVAEKFGAERAQDLLSRADKVRQSVEGAVEDAVKRAMTHNEPEA